MVKLPGPKENAKTNSMGMVAARKSLARVKKLRDDALVLITESKFAEALPLYEELCSLEPTEGEWPRRAADCCWHLKQTSKRLAFSVRAAKAYGAEGHLLKAIAMCKVALSIDPRHKESLSELARLHANKPEAKARAKPAGVRAVGGIPKDPVQAVRLAQAKREAEQSTSSSNEERERRKRARMAAAAALRKTRTEQAQSARQAQPAPHSQPKAPEEATGVLGRIALKPKFVPPVEIREVRASSAPPIATVPSIPSLRLPPPSEKPHPPLADLILSERVLANKQPSLHPERGNIYSLTLSEIPARELRAARLPNIKLDPSEPPSQGDPTVARISGPAGAYDRPLRGAPEPAPVSQFDLGNGVPPAGSEPPSESTPPLDSPPLSLTDPSYFAQPPSVPEPLSPTQLPSIPDLLSYSEPPGPHRPPNQHRPPNEHRPPSDLAPLSDFGPNSLSLIPTSLAEPESVPTFGSLPPGSVGSTLDRQQIDKITLEHTPLFDQLAPDLLEYLIDIISVVELSAHEVLFNEGDIADSMYVIVEGSVVAMTAPQGDRPIELARLEEGDFFGEIGLLSDQPRQATVSACEPTRLLRFDRSTIGFMVDQDQGFLAVLLQFLKARLVDDLMLTSPLFAPFSEAERRLLVEQFEFLEIDANAVLLDHGQSPIGMYVLLTGSALLSTRANDPSALRQLTPGVIFGEQALLHNEPSEIQVRTTSKCFALCLPSDAFGEVIMTHPTILEYLSSLSQDDSLHVRAEFLDQINFF